METYIDLNDIMKLNNLSFVNNIKQLVRSITNNSFDKSKCLKKSNVNIVEELAFERQFLYGNCEKSIYDYLDTSFMFSNGKIRIIYVDDWDDTFKSFKFKTKSSVRQGEINSFITILCGSSVNNDSDIFKLVDYIIRCRIAAHLGSDRIFEEFSIDGPITTIATTQNIVYWANYHICRFSILDSVFNLKYDDYDKYIYSSCSRYAYKLIFDYAITEDKEEQDYKELLRNCIKNINRIDLKA